MMKRLKSLRGGVSSKQIISIIGYSGASMNHRLESQKLWAALSYAFVDNEVDFKCMAKEIKGYPIEEVEFAFFERVAPVCIYNMLTPAPPICWYFDKEELVADIEAMIEKRSQQGLLGSLKCAVERRWIGFLARRIWATIKLEVERAATDCHGVRK